MDVKCKGDSLHSLHRKDGKGNGERSAISLFFILIKKKERAGGVSRCGRPDIKQRGGEGGKLPGEAVSGEEFSQC